MATPIFACGAECGVFLSSGPHSNGGLNTSIDTTTFRSGLRSFRVNPSAATGYIDTIALASSASWVVRFYIRFVTVPSATSAVFRLGAQTQGVYYNASDGKLYAGSAPGTLGASGVSVTTGQWYRIDVKTTATTVDVQVDGVAVGQLSGSYSASTVLRFGDSTTSSTRDVYYDDILASQTTADYPLGAGFVKSYIPNADGTHNVAGANDFERTLTGTDITNATTTAYQLIDDRPLPSTAVDFINGIAPPNATDYVEWTYETSSESNDPRHVEGMLIHHDASGAGTNDFTVTLRRNTGGASSNIWTGTTNVGSSITAKRAAFAQAPGSVAWTTAIFNDLRSRFLVSDASPDPYLDAAMLEVEFPEGAPAETADAEVATGTGSSFVASILLAVSATLASGTGAAFDATAQVGKSVSAELASGSGQAFNLTSTIQAGIGAATGTGAAGTVSASIETNGGAATGTGAAGSVAGGVAGSAGVATGTGEAGAPAPTLDTLPGHAQGTGQAFDATVSTATETNANAGHASGTGQAFGTSISLAPTGGVAAGTGTAHTIAAAVSGSSGFATGTGSAEAPAPSVAPNPGHAAGTGSAFDATVSTGSFVEVFAEVATGTGAAFGPTATIEAGIGAASGTGTSFGTSAALASNGGVATGSGTAGGPASSVAVTPAAAIGTGAAFDASVSGAAVTVNAGLASGTGTAYNASIFGRGFIGSISSPGTTGQVTTEPGVLVSISSGSGTTGRVD